MSLWTSSTPASPTTAPPTPSFKVKYQGRRVAQIVKLKPEYVEEYKQCHAKVWPEVLKQIKDSNIEDCEYFLLLLIFVRWLVAVGAVVALLPPPSRFGL